MSIVTKPRLSRYTQHTSMTWSTARQLQENMPTASRGDLPYVKVLGCFKQEHVQHIDLSEQCRRITSFPEWL
eukprot:1355128-Amphidinium_carterae.1